MLKLTSGACRTVFFALAVVAWVFMNCLLKSPHKCMTLWVVFLNLSFVNNLWLVHQKRDKSYTNLDKLGETIFWFSQALENSQTPDIEFDIVVKKLISLKWLLICGFEITSTFWVWSIRKHCATVINPISVTEGDRKLSSPLPRSFLPPHFFVAAKGHHHRLEHESSLEHYFILSSRCWHLIDNVV